MNADMVLRDYPIYKPTGNEKSADGLAIKDFTEPQGKKKGFEAHGHSDNVVKGGLDTFTCTRNELMNTHEKVEGQYGGRVGTFYSMVQCSLWIGAALVNCKHPKGVASEAVLAGSVAIAVTGSLYEDLGLAGYSPKAEAFSGCTEQLVKPSGVLRVRESETVDVLKRLKAFSSMEALKELVKEELEDEDPSDRLYVHERGMIVLLKECLGIDVDNRAAKLVLVSRQVGLCYGAMERGKTKPSYGDASFLGKPLKEFAAIVGTMRRASKGLLASDRHIEAIVYSIIDPDETDDDGEVRKALPQLVDDDLVKYYFGNNPSLTGLVFKAKNVMLGALNAKANEVVRQEEFWELHG